MRVDFKNGNLETAIQAKVESEHSTGNKDYKASDAAVELMVAGLHYVRQGGEVAQKPARVKDATQLPTMDEVEEFCKTENLMPPNIGWGVLNEMREAVRDWKMWVRRKYEGAGPPEPAKTVSLGQ